MAGSPGTLKNALEDWLEQNFPSGYTSCIKIQGRPILPPVMSEERRIEMRRLKDMAIDIEKRLMQKKANVQEDTAAGEAMYEGTPDELHFANSLPTSLAAYQEQPTHALTNEEISQTLEDALELIEAQSMPETAQSKDMLKEFDPLAEEYRTHSPTDLLAFNSENASDKNVMASEKTVSKPSSADSSVALSYSTDLNNYMDITEGSVDVSMLCSEQKSISRTGVSTPSTVRPDSAGSQSVSSMPWKDRKATYEDLNNYLDSLLNNNSDSKKQKPAKDSNQNVLNSSTSPESSQRTISPPGPSEGLKPLNGKPPPLTSPQGSLQTRIINDNNQLATPTRKNVDQVSDFLQSCALSPVIQNDVKNSYEQKVQLYLQNLVIDEGVMKELTQMASSQLENHTESLDKTFTETCSPKYSVNDDKRNAESNYNGCVPAPPRLVRSNSYTLDSPSPMLLAHMEAELRKNDSKEPNMGENTDNSQDMGPSRRVWDVEPNKNMPSWCSRSSNVSSATSKTLSPKKLLSRSVSAQPITVKNVDQRGLSSESSQKLLRDRISTKPSADQSKIRKSSLGSAQKENSGKAMPNSQEVSVPIGNDSKDKARTLLLHLQLQHNQEMEELLNRQRKETEAIRLALLEEQKCALRASEEAIEACLSSTSTNSLISAQSQSPPTKDKSLQMERRNTSPSIYKKDSANMLQSGQVECMRSASVSSDRVTPSIDLGGGSSLIDLGLDESALNNNKCIPYQEVYGNTQRTNLMSLPGHGDILPPPLRGSYNGSSEMISSFPPSDLPICQMERMTSSLPAEILSVHFANTELTFQNANTVSCTSQSSVISISKPTSVSADITSVAPNIFSSAFASSVTSGSPRTKRRSWCSRQLFPEECSQSHPDWVTQTYQLQRHQAATKIQAGVRGYLTRRLLKTERVQNCITTIRDTIVCALQLQRECAPHVEPSDLQLHGRLIQQLSAACEDLHNIFMGTPVKRRMAIIAADRERLRIRTPRSRSSLGSRPLSRATQIALQRKSNQSDPLDSASVHSRSSSTNRSRRRSWAVETRSKGSVIPTNLANNCEVVSGCLSRSSAPMSLPLQRSASAGSSRKPWR